MTSGILIVDKPQDWTSHDVVAKLRRVFGEKRIGHAGTLDPMATGVLPIFLGRATRVVEFATEGEKEYLAGITLGTITDTQDITGTILETRPVTVGESALLQIFPEFTGEIQQIPPMYSAIKIQGKKLYELARKGKTVKRPPRSITIHQLNLEQSQQSHTFLVRVACSKGTYIRTLCHDMGERLGCGATLSSLQRTKAAGYSLEQSHSLEEILQHPKPHALLLPTDSYFTQPVLHVTPQQEQKIRNGSSCQLTTTQQAQVSAGAYRVYGEGGTFLALCQIKHQKMTTIKSFFEVVHQ